MIRCSVAQFKSEIVVYMYNIVTFSCKDMMCDFCKTLYVSS